MALNTLTFRVAADSWNGDPSFIVMVDGKQVGGTWTASASHSAGAWQDVTVTGSFAATPSSIALSFLNDGYGGWGQDRNLYVQGVTMNGKAVETSKVNGNSNTIVDGVTTMLSNGMLTFDTSSLTNATATPVTAAAANTIALRVAADSWSGNPQFTVTVDGQQVGGRLTAAASHAAGAWQDVIVTGAFAATPSSVAVSFVNDGYDGSATADRNLYVQSASVNGTALVAATVTGDSNSIVAGVTTLLSNGTVNFKAAPSTSPKTTPPVATTTTPVAATGNTLVFRVAADSWSGNPQFTVAVDGKQVGGTQTASASHAAGTWQDVVVTGAFSATPSSIALTFVNDGYGGSATADRNLYVQGLTLNGQTVAASKVNGDGNTIAAGVTTLLSNGTLTFDMSGLVGTAPVAVTPPTPAPVVASPVVTTPTAPTAATNTLVLRVAADSWNGNPQFTMAVDGQQVGGTLSATASHAAGVWQDVTVTGAFAATPASVAVSFVNDGYGGSAAADRNLYLQSVALNGVDLAGATVDGTGNAIAGGLTSLLSNGTATFKASAAASPSTTPVTTPPATTTNSLVLRVAADSWSGNPQFTVTVDGQQVGGTYTAAASHAAGAWQDVTVTGSFSATASSVAVNFADDAYGGYGMDRNMYVQSLAIGGKTFSAANATDTGGSTSTGLASLLTNGSVTFDTSTLANGTGSTLVDHGLQLLGVNLAGAEFGAGSIPGTYGTNYTYPTHGEIDYYASKGMDVIRIPFLWERMQSGLNGPLNQSELARLKDVVDYATSKGLKSILDVHNYGAGFGNLVGSAGTPNSAFADLWGKLASNFGANPDVIYGLMNEPNAQSATDWLGSANAAIAAIRGAGAHGEILVPGTHWDGAWTWTSSDNAGVIGTGIKDPDANYAFEVHQYLDPDGSGTKAGVSSDTIGVDRLASVTKWAEDHGAKLFLGEFGVTQDQQSLAALDKMLGFMGQHADVWQGGTYWAGGPWWYGSNIYGVEPTDLGTAGVRDQPQMAILSSHTAHGGS